MSEVPKSAGTVSSSLKPGNTLQEKVADKAIIRYVPEDVEDLERILENALQKDQLVLFTETEFSPSVDDALSKLDGMPKYSLVDLSILKQKVGKSVPEEPKRPRVYDDDIEKKREKLQKLIGESPQLIIEVYQNWGRNQSARVITATPKTVSDVKKIIQAASIEAVQVRCIGAGHSWGPLFADEGELLLKTHEMTSDYEDGAKIRFRGDNLVDVLTGVTTGDLKSFQLRNKVNLPCNVILEVVQMVSVITSGCHGVGQDVKTPGDYIVQVRVIQSDGQLHTYKLEESKDMIKALSSNFGVFGFVYDVTFQLFPEDKIRTRNAYIKLGEMTESQILKSLFETYWSVEMFWFPFNSYKAFHTWEPNNDEVWVRKIDKDPAINEVESDALYVIQNINDYLSQVILCCAKWLYIHIPSLTPVLSKVAFRLLKGYLYPEDKPLEQELVHGIHFRNHIHMVPVRDMEFAFDMKEKNGETDYERICDIINVVKEKTEQFYKDSKYPLNIAMEMRLMGYSESFLNPASIGNREYGGSGNVLYIEVLSLIDTTYFEEFCKEIATKWMEYDGVPHLAKDWEFIEGITPYIQDKMKENIVQFKEQLRKSGADPNCIMTNKKIRELLGLNGTTAARK